jgi:hypothetical protein
VFWVWAAITTINLAWVATLWRRRERDHPWLLPYFSTYFISDVIMWMGSSTAVGGLNLFTPNLVGRQPYVIGLCLVWCSWFCIPLFTARKLAHNRVGWRWVVVTVAIAVLVSASESLGLTPYQRRFLMHRLTEPAFLIVALWILVRHSVPKIRKGKAPSFLAFVVMASSVVLLIRLALLYSGKLELQRVGAVALYATYILAVVTLYFYDERIRRWMERPF